MAKPRVGLPRNNVQWIEAGLVASVILIIAVTPTLFDAYDAWDKHPHIRPWLAIWYVFAATVALISWEVFAK